MFFAYNRGDARVEVPHRDLVKGQTLKLTKLVSRGRFAQLVQIVNARVGQGTLPKTKRKKKKMNEKQTTQSNLSGVNIWIFGYGKVAS